MPTSNLLQFTLTYTVPATYALLPAIGSQSKKIMRTWTAGADSQQQATASPVRS